MLFIPWIVSFVPNYLYFDFNHDKYYIEIQFKVNFKNILSKGGDV